MNPLSRPVLSIAVLSAVIVLISLGTWQLYRLEWKLGLIDAVETRMNSEPVSLTQVLARPMESREWQAVVFDATGQGDRVAHIVGSYDGKPGYYVFTLVTLANGGELPVNHGFVPNEAKAEEYDLGLPGRIEGLYRRPRELKGLAKSITPPPDTDKGLFYARNVEGPIAYLFGETPPGEAFYIDRTDNADAVPKGGTSHVAFSNNHLGYALTWYGLAIGLIGVYIVMLRGKPPA